MFTAWGETSERGHDGIALFDGKLRRGCDELADVLRVQLYLEIALGLEQIRVVLRS